METWRAQWTTQEWLNTMTTGPWTPAEWGFWWAHQYEQAAFTEWIANLRAGPHLVITPDGEPFFPHDGEGLQMHNGAETIHAIDPLTENDV